MKQTLKFFCLCLLILSLLLQGCKRKKDEDTDGGSSVRNDRPTISDQVQQYHTDMQYSYATPVNEEILKTGLDAEYLLLANKKFPLGETFVPKSLTKLRADVTYYGKDIELDSRAAQALYLMLGEMNAAGVTDVMVTSGYRSYERQAYLFNYYLSEESKGISSNAVACFGYDYIQQHYIDRGLEVLSAADAKTVVLSYSAYPGTSEHQTGLCLDFMTSTMTDLDNSFALTPAFEWLINNAYRFGFILRYPEGREGITGYTYEPWHYRFVGREAATDIHFGKITLEQYLGQ